jgi:hypothetical protein
MAAPTIHVSHSLERYALIADLRLLLYVRQTAIFTMGEQSLDDSSSSKFEVLVADWLSRTV